MLQSNVIVNNNDMTHVMHLALLQMAIKNVVNLYLTPFKVYNDEKASRGPLYIITGAFWRDCCRVCRGVPSDVDDEYGEVVGGESEVPDIFKDKRRD